MRLILFLGLFILAPVLINLIFKIIKVRPNHWGYILNYILLIVYPFFLYRTFNNAEPPSDVKGWSEIYSIAIYLIVIFILAPISVWLQSLTRQWIFKKT